MRESGVIAGFRAIVDPAAAGRTLVALIDVRLEGPGETGRFERLIESLDEVTDAAHVTGRFDYQLRVACTDTAELDRLLRQLKTEIGASATETRVILRSAIARWAA